MAEDIRDFNETTNMTAGEILREARTTGRRKREIPTIAKQLCIREEFLQALEDGNYTVIPETVYILGFARNYAMELGLDADMIVEKIKKELGIVPSDLQNVHPNVSVQPEKTEPEKRVSLGEHVGKIKKSNAYKFIVRHWLWFAGGALLLILCLVAFVMILPNGHKSAPVPVVQEQVVPATQPEPDFKKPVRERFGTENRKDAEIVLQSISESWVKIEDARGKTVFSRVLVPGDVYYMPSGNKNRATFGNAGGIDIWVRGELVAHVGENNTRKTGILMDADKLMAGKSEQE